MSYSRFAICSVPPEGALAEFGAAWLGWDLPRGDASPWFDISGLREGVAAPRK